MSLLNWLPIALLVVFGVLGFLFLVVLPRLSGSALPMKPMVLSSASKVVKATTCDTCGARQVRASPSPYVYCDYCASLVDYDMRRAFDLHGWQNRPAKIFAELIAVEKPQRDAALARGDHDAFRRSFHEVVRQHHAQFPAHGPPGMADPAYRQAFHHYLVELNLRVATDPELDRLGTVEGVRYTRRVGEPRLANTYDFRTIVVPSTVAYLARFMPIVEQVRHLHPDQPSFETLRRFYAARNVQNWLPFLSTEDQQHMIEALGVADQYVPVVAVATTERHCGHCGNTLEAPHGATRGLCFACGHRSDFAHAELTCPNCTGTMSIPDSSQRFPCPYCKSEVRVEG